MNFCPECGTKLEPEWKNCPNCGSRVIGGEENLLRKPEPVSYTHQVRYYAPQETYSYRDQSNTYGIVSLIFGILGLIFLPCIGAIIAIIFGNLGKKKDANPHLANIGYVLGIIGIFCCCCLFMLPFMLLPMVFF